MSDHQHSYQMTYTDNNLDRAADEWHQHHWYQWHCPWWITLMSGNRHTHTHIRWQTPTAQNTFYYNVALLVLPIMTDTSILRTLPHPHTPTPTYTHPFSLSHTSTFFANPVALGNILFRQSPAATGPSTTCNRVRSKWMSCAIHMKKWSRIWKSVISRILKYIYIYICMYIHTSYVPV